jgi:hypothetical protein
MLIKSNLGVSLPDNLTISSSISLVSYGNSTPSLYLGISPPPIHTSFFIKNHLHYLFLDFLDSNNDIALGNPFSLAIFK